MPDTLTVTGIGKRIDGTYDCDLTALLVDVTSDQALLVSEAEIIKRLSGASGYGIGQAFLSGDWTVRMAVALIVLHRHDVNLTEQQGWAAKVGAFTFQMEDDLADEGDEAADPPEEGQTPSENGGESGSQTSAPNQETDRPATGRLESVA